MIIINIFERYTDLKKSNKQEFDNNKLWIEKLIQHQN